MKYFLSLSLLFFANTGNAEPIRVAVIDTGLSKAHWHKVKMCDKEFKTFDGTLEDFSGHGTNVTGIIYKNTKADYCFLFAKFTNGYGNKNSMPALINSINWAINKKADIINISAGGFGKDVEEKKVIQKALKNKIHIVAAAGNNATNIDNNPFYPAGYHKDIIVVGNGKNLKEKDPTSNYGLTVDFWIPGNNVKGFDIRLSGSSQSTAIYTARLANTLGHYRSVSSEEAPGAVLEALYKDSKVEENINKKIKKYQEKVPEQYHFLFPLTKIILDRKIKVQHEF